MKQIRSWVFAGLVAFFAFVAVGLAPGHIQAQALQKVRIAIPTINVLTRPWYIAKDKGFYAAEGLDPEFIYVQGTLQPPALVNGEIDFAPSGDLGPTPDPDIFLLGVGEQTNRFAALQAGSADGMIVDPGLALAAQKKGFHILSRVGEQLELIQVGLAMSNQKLKSHLDLARR